MKLTLSEHKKYGAKEKPVKILEFMKGKNNKKYTVLIQFKGKIHEISFGSPDYFHFHDRLGLWSDQDHNDQVRRERYLVRASAITDKHGKKTINDPLSPNYYAIRLLW